MIATSGILPKRLAEARKNRRLTAKEVAAVLGVAVSTISNYENGKRIPSVHTLVELAEIYRTSLFWFLDLKSDNIDTIFSVKQEINVPILGVIRAGEPILAEQNILGETTLDSQYKGKGEFFALYVIGDSMNNSRICDGDIVIVRRQDMVENGEVAVVLIDNENATIKKFYKTESTVTLVPNSSNASHQPRMVDLKRESVHVLGKIVEVKIKV